MVNGARIVPPSRYFLEPDLADQIEPPGHGPHDTAESHGDLVVGTPGLRRDAKIVVEAYSSGRIPIASRYAAIASARFLWRLRGTPRW